MITRTLYLPDNIIGCLSGVGLYTFNPEGGELLPVHDLPPSGRAFQFYEISVIDDVGSWWLPTAAEDRIPEAWQQPARGGVEPIESTGAIWTSEAGIPLYRPTQLLWWIALSTLPAKSFVPGYVNGLISGIFPLFAPAAPASSTLSKHSQ